MTPERAVDELPIAEALAEFLGPEDSISSYADLLHHIEDEEDMEDTEA
jgi:hypothetical protein